jgi:hypothetical protein
MGDRLLGYYRYAAKKGGLVLQLKLAMKTRLPSPRAEAAPDSPENLELFHRSLKELLPEEPDIPD